MIVQRSIHRTSRLLSNACSSPSGGVTPWVCDGGIDKWVRWLMEIGTCRLVEGRPVSILNRNSLRGGSELGDVGEETGLATLLIFGSAG
jgi:hypothetical protein